MKEVWTDLVETMSLVKGNVERELLLRNEYLAAEKKILRSRIKNRWFIRSFCNRHLKRVPTGHGRFRQLRTGRQRAIQGSAAPFLPLPSRDIPERRP